MGEAVAEVVGPILIQALVALCLFKFGHSVGYDEGTAAGSTAPPRTDPGTEVTRVTRTVRLGDGLPDFSRPDPPRPTPQR